MELSVGGVTVLGNVSDLDQVTGLRNRFKQAIE